MKKTALFTIIVVITSLIFSCSTPQTEKELTLPPISVKTTHVALGTICNYIDVNASTIYLNKSTVVAPMASYVEKVNIQLGDMVHKNDVLFLLKSKESKALNSDVGNMEILAPSMGTIAELPVSSIGNYVTEGQTLCTISESQHAIIQANIPYNYNKQISTGYSCNITLPDGNILKGQVQKILPFIDEINQTQHILIAPLTKTKLPEQLNVSVQFKVNVHLNSTLVNKKALMSNEEQTKFWVMKIINDSLAIKTAITKGLENDSLVEIISGNLQINEILITDGAYGLQDSSIVKIAN